MGNLNYDDYDFSNKARRVNLVASSGGVPARTDVVYNGTTALTPVFARINASSSGDNTLVSAVTGKKIRVLAVCMIAAGDVTSTFESGTTSGEVFGPLDLTTNSGFTLPFNPVGWFETASGELLNLILDAAINVGGGLVYVEV